MEDLMSEKDNGDNAFPADASTNLFSRGMTLRDYAAIRAPAEIPEWFQIKLEMPRPETPSSNELTRDQREEWDEIGAYEASDPKIIDFDRRYKEARHAQGKWDTDLAISRYFAWRYYYADMMLKARQS
jgi:hypothetical protein